MITIILSEYHLFDVGEYTAIVAALETLLEVTLLNVAAVFGKG